MPFFDSNIRYGLRDEFIASLKNNLSKKVITSCSKWSEKYRVIKGQRWTFRRYPWLRGMHDSLATINVGQKAAQVGYTETMLNISFYNIDIGRKDVLYVLPSMKPDATEFSASRFNPSIEESEYLSHLFSDVRNVGHKRAGNSNLYIRGAKSRSQLKSVPAGVVIFDETDEMTKEAVRLGFERTSGQVEKLIWLVSTPSHEDYGISIYFKDSSQNAFYFKCPGCNRFITLEFPDSLVIHGEGVADTNLHNSYLKCSLADCGVKLPHETKTDWLSTGRWVEKYSNREIKGWHISQLYSTTITPGELVKSYFYGMSDQSFEQEFYNSKLGLTHEVEGARITDHQITRILQSSSYTKILRIDDINKLVTIGVDVGYPYSHFEVDEWYIPQYTISNDVNIVARPRVISFGKVKNIEEVDNILADFNARYCVIDAQPERRKALELANRCWGRVRLAFYSPSVMGKNIHISDMNNEPTLTVDNTSWLDLSLGRFKTGNISLPIDIDTEYREHIKAPVRTYRIDKLGNKVGTYINTKADHYAHARNYAEIALQMALSLASSQTITSVF